MSSVGQQFSHYPAISAPAAVRTALRVLPEHPCSYFPDRVAETRAFYATGKLPPRIYHDCMDAGFRRSGRVIYQPICRGCRDCISIRVPVETFKPNKSQRRCWNRNVDLTVTVGVPVADDEAFDLYLRYLRDWHGDRSHDATDRASFESFLYDSPIDTLEFRYRSAAGDLLAVGICDICESSLSSMYFYFDPAHRRRGLGTFGALRELAFAREICVPYYYLGYWIANCAAMSYKANFGPYELLGGDGVWRAGQAAR